MDVEIELVERPDPAIMLAKPTQDQQRFYQGHAPATGTLWASTSTEGSSM